MKKAVIMCGPHSPFTREILNAMVSSIGTYIPYDWWTLIKVFLKPGEYLQYTTWFQDIARDHTNENARAGALPNQITFEMLTGTRQFDAVEAQIQCLPLLHEELKTVALEAWDRITPQGEPTGSYIKILQGPKICRWHHPYGRRWRGTQKPLDEDERGAWKSWLKAQPFRKRRSWHLVPSLHGK